MSANRARVIQDLSRPVWENEIPKTEMAQKMEDALDTIGAAEVSNADDFVAGIAKAADRLVASACDSPYIAMRLIRSVCYGAESQHKYLTETMLPNMAGGLQKRVRNFSGNEIDSVEIDNLIDKIASTEEDAACVKAIAERLIEVHDNWASAFSGDSQYSFGPFRSPEPDAANRALNARAEQIAKKYGVSSGQRGPSRSGDGTPVADRTRIDR